MASQTDPRDAARRVASAPPDLSTSTTSDLLALYGSILTQLRDRKIIRSENSPVGDYAEHLAERAFGLTLVQNSSIGYDGVDADGLRYQVKGRRITPLNKSRQLGILRGLNAEPPPFEVLVAILFNPDFSILRAARMPIEVVRTKAARHDYVNGWRLILNDPVWMLDGVEDITNRITLAAGGLGVDRV